jgi:hypothetical protein
MSQFSIKNILNISLFLNLLLLTGCLWLLQKPRQPFPTHEETVSASHPPSETIKNSLPTPERFSWRQLETDDYVQFVSNLRGVDCPEPTIEAIVSNELEGLYTERVKQLESTYAKTSDKRNLATEIQALWTEEKALLSKLLGYNPAPENQKLETVANTESQMDFVIPAAFALISAENSGLDADQISILEGLKSGFISQLGTYKPSDPEYQSRWKEAQPALDRKIRTLLGQQAFQKLQNSIARSQME